MSVVTTAQVKELRDATGISLMKCKTALEEAQGDMEAARDILRKSGEKDAAKKSDRSTSEGLVATKISADGTAAVMIQILCETDFVGRGDEVAALAEQLATRALEQGIDAAQAEAVTLTQAAVQKIGENIRAGEMHRFTATGVIGSYIHSNKKIGVLVGLKKGTEELARDLAMQVAALNPLVVRPEDVSDAMVAKEREIQTELVAQEGKPADMQEKIVEGKMRKYRDEQSLIKQPFVKDGSKTVEQLLKEQGAEVEAFVRLSI